MIASSSNQLWLMNGEVPAIIYKLANWFGESLNEI